MGFINSVRNVLSGYKELEFTVEEVVFKDDRPSPHSIMRAMKYHDVPYEIYQITFQRNSVNGSFSIGVYANGDQIGNVPYNILNDFDKKWKSHYMIESCEVRGNGDDQPFACVIKVLFSK